MKQKAYSPHVDGIARHGFIDAPGLPPLPADQVQEAVVAFRHGGLDTREIAHIQGVLECDVYNALSRQRESSRGGSDA
jgi:hypothetical protein